MHAVLRGAGEARAPWAAFDAAWYLRAYPDVAAALGTDDPARAREEYLESGQHAGRSPNPFFDEEWYRGAHRGAAAAIREGRAISGFDIYCRHGFSGHAPHWLFSEAFYRRRYPDLTEESLHAGGFVNGYDHYLRIGDREGRSGSLLFDPRFYLAQLSPEDAEAAAAEGCFRHYLRCLAAGDAEQRTSIYFDPVWYLSRYPALAEAIGPDRPWCSALHHFLANPTPAKFDPLPYFSEAFYLARYPDIAAAVEARTWRAGYLHFLHHGANERRAPSAAIDLRYYTEANPSVAEDLASGRAPDPFAHYLAIGRSQGLSAAPPAQTLPDEAEGEALFRARAQALLPVLARAPLDFSHDGPPALSAILVARDGFALTLASLASLRASFAGAIELILIDSGSTDETRHIERYVTGATLLRFGADIGPLRGANGALPCVSAASVLLLDPGIEVMPGVVAAALRRLGSDPRVGAVGGKVIRAHGRLREAGGIVWRDGTIRLYQRDAAPLAAEANFVRDVDFCSACFLIARTEAVRALGGFDAAFESGREDVDLCLGLAAAGWRVVYDPAVVTICHESGRGTGRRGPEPALPGATPLLLRKHQRQLRFRSLPDARLDVFARSREAAPRRVLFIDDTVPIRMAGSGFVRSNDLIRAMAGLGWSVSVFPITRPRFDPAAIFADLPDTAEVLFESEIDRLAEFLRARAGYYDAIWIARTHNLDRIRPALEQALGSAGRPPQLILDTEAIAALRQAGRAGLATPPADFDLQAALAEEFRNAGLCQHLVAVSEAEAAMLRGLGFTNVSVIGHMRAQLPAPRGFAERSGMLFVGAIHETAAPNFDALCWFVDTVLPLVERELRWETRLTVAGYVAPGVDLGRFRAHPRLSLRGAAADLEPLYDAHRVFVAPTRFAAGLPYKLHEAASFGLPIVGTTLLRGQLGWEDEMLAVEAGDAEGFAANVLRLYRDAALWSRVREQARARIATETAPARTIAALQAILG